MNGCTINDLKYEEFKKDSRLSEMLRSSSMNVSDLKIVTKR